MVRICMRRVPMNIRYLATAVFLRLVSDRQRGNGSVSMARRVSYKELLVDRRYNGRSARSALLVDRGQCRSIGVVFEWVPTYREVLCGLIFTVP